MISVIPGTEDLEAPESDGCIFGIFPGVYTIYPQNQNQAKRNSESTYDVTGGLKDGEY